jgi:Spherulation-specific family 4
MSTTEANRGVGPAAGTTGVPLGRWLDRRRFLRIAGAAGLACGIGPRLAGGVPGASAAVCDQRLAVPAFFPLGDDWTRIEQAGSKVHLVVPEFSFSTVDPATNPDLLKAARQQFARCRNKGQKILGYVSTQGGARNRAAIDADIDRWFARYPTQLDGIFFDEGPVAWVDTEAFYTDLIGGFKARHPQRSLAMLNAPQYPHEWVLAEADFVILWEEDEAAYVNHYGALDANQNVIAPPGWWKKRANRNRIVHVVHGCPGAKLGNVVRLSKKRNAGRLYVFDGGSGAYDRLPTYWKKLLQAACAPPS